MSTLDVNKDPAVAGTDNPRKRKFYDFGSQKYYDINKQIKSNGQVSKEKNKKTGNSKSLGNPDDFVDNIVSDILQRSKNCIEKSQNITRKANKKKDALISEVDCIIEMKEFIHKNLKHYEDKKMIDKESIDKYEKKINVIRDQLLSLKKNKLVKESEFCVLCILNGKEKIGCKLKCGHSLCIECYCNIPCEKRAELKYVEDDIKIDAKKRCPVCRDEKPFQFKLKNGNLVLPDGEVLTRTLSSSTDRIGSILGDFIGGAIQSQLDGLRSGTQTGVTRVNIPLHSIPIIRNRPNDRNQENNRTPNIRSNRPSMPNSLPESIFSEQENLDFQVNRSMGNQTSINNANTDTFDNITPSNTPVPTSVNGGHRLSDANNTAQGVFQVYSYDPTFGRYLERHL